MVWGGYAKGERLVIALGALVVYFGVIWLTMSAAESRGRGQVRWGLAAAVFGIFAWIPLVLVGNSKKGLERQRAEDLERIEEEEAARMRARQRLSAKP